VPPTEGKKATGRELLSPCEILCFVVFEPVVSLGPKLLDVACVDQIFGNVAIFKFSQEFSLIYVVNFHQ
jgi:hypothetical protein